MDSSTTRVLKLSSKEERVETGLIKFSYGKREDWTGIFLRGDSAFGYAMALKQFKENPQDDIAGKFIEGLIKLLDSSNEGVGELDGL